MATMSISVIYFGGGSIQEDTWWSVVSDTPQAPPCSLRPAFFTSHHSLAAACPGCTPFPTLCSYSRVSATPHLCSANLEVQGVTPTGGSRWRAAPLSRLQADSLRSTSHIAPWVSPVPHGTGQLNIAPEDGCALLPHFTLLLPVLFPGITFQSEPPVHEPQLRPCFLWHPRPRPVYVSQETACSAVNLKLCWRKRTFLP